MSTPWRPYDPHRRAVIAEPVGIAPECDKYALSAAERAGLVRYRDVYPWLEWTEDARQLAYLRFVAYRFRKDHDRG